MPARPLPMILALALGGLFACDEANEGKSEVSPEEACDLIVAACHTKDDLTDAAIAECHSQAHDGQVGTSAHQQICFDRLDECVDLCEAAPEAEDHDGTDSEADDRY